VTVTVNLPDDAARRLAAEAARRGITVDQVIAELVAAHLAADTKSAEDALEAFIGSGASGRGDLGRRHRQIRAEMTEGLAARDL
jgi:hypothetical protein